MTPVSIRAGWLEQLFPNWRMLFGAAVASLVLSAVFLRTRLGAPEAVASARLDTVIVSDGSPPAGTRRLAIGNLATGFTLTAPFAGSRSNPGWIDSLPHSWSNAVPAPLGLRVALTHATSHGTDLVVVSANRRDSVVLLSGQPNTTPLGWSPDGTWLLASQRTSGAAGSDARLLALPRRGELPPRAIDTSRGHSVTEAQWSPDGAHIAWVARVGEDKQLEVYTSFADGSDVRNVSRNVAEDYHIAWSPDGDLLCFTSTRDGIAGLYAMDLAEDRLWRLTRNSAHTDHCMFSPDGRAVAFESTRGGTLGVYVMPALGGQPRLIARGSRIEIVGWGGQRSRFVSYVSITTRDIPVGRSGIVRARAFDFLGDSITPRNVEWTVLDSAVAQFSGGGDRTSSARSLVGRRSGVARVVATVGHWRSDTAVVRVGDGAVSLLRDDLHAGLGQWHVLGMPTPVPSSGSVNGLALRAPRDWEAGLLSRASLPLAPGLRVDATIAAPWTAPPDAMTQTIVALVTPEDVAAADSAAPEFPGVASMRWKADAARMVYAVGREIFTEPIDAASHTSRQFSMLIEQDSTVTFLLDDKRRWRSTLRLGTARGSTRAQVWLAGRATAAGVRVLSASAALSARRTQRPTD